MPNGMNRFPPWTLNRRGRVFLLRHFEPVSTLTLTTRALAVRLANSVTSEVIVIDRFPALVGRAPEADVPLDDAKIGNYQCMIDRTHLGLVIWDL